MILDAFTFLAGSISSQNVITAQAFNGAGNILGSNTLDTMPLTLGANTFWDLGQGEPMEIAFSIVTAPTVGTSCQFQLIQADDAALTSNVQVLVQTDAIPLASLPAGRLVPLHWDRTSPYTPKRYIGVRVVNVGAIATFTAIAALAKTLQDLQNIYGKSGFLVS